MTSSYHHGITRLFLSALWILSCCNTPVANALFADEAGVSDFLVATAGHGPTTFVHYSSSHHDADGVVITSDSPVAGHRLTTTDNDKAATSCFVASRSAETGALLWRRNVCANNEKAASHATGAASEGVWTMDSSGIVRAWTVQGGQLLWDALLRPTVQPRVLVPPAVVVDDDGVTMPSAVGAVADELMLLLDATTGEAMGAPLNAERVLKQHGGSSSSRGQARWLQLISDEPNQWRVLLGWVYTSGDTVTTSGSDLLVVTLEWHEEALKITGSQRLNHIKQLDVSSLHIHAAGTGMALSADGKQAMSFGVSNGASNCDMGDISERLSWSGLTSVAALSHSVARVSGTDASTGKEMNALFQLPSWAPLQDGQSGGTLMASGLVYASCGGSSGVVAAIQSEEPKLQLWTTTDGDATLKKVSTDVSQGTVSSNALESPTMTALRCVDSSLDLLLSTSSGTTASVQAPFSASSSSPVWKWTAEEGLGHIASALLLDASHAVVVDDLVGEDSEQEPDEIAQRLQFSARLSSQWKSLLGSGMSLVSSSSSSAKDRLFGFLQVAVLVSEQTDRLYGMELAGAKRGSILWSVDLSSQASWHKLVHGTFNAIKASHGIHGGTHAKEVLVVSAHSDRVDWKCIDGTNGEIHAEGALEISSPVMQVLPMVGGGLCRQQAVLIHEDRSTSVIPDSDSSSQSSLKHVLETSTNGLYAHVLSGAEDAARLESYQITSQSSPARLVGQTSFPGERLVHAVYPTRDEVVNSPCAVLGDDSLLLKYLNPHLAVLVTVRDAGVAGDEDPFDAALRQSTQQTDKKKKKKPLGVTPKAGAKADPAAVDADPAVVKDDEPNLFVNVVDTVSGRVLYRASHANAATSARHIRSVISENWIVYSFVNAKTKKTEVGVLSLYEGMIHKKGLTAFTSPEQTTEFSSWDARETKPVVLAKTYSIANPVTALGVTQTRNGISAHQILLATSDDHIFAVGRNVLEPRRPLSDLKDSEKLEGLRQYSELIPLVSLQALSYNLTVQGPTHILSASTELESQTLVFAYGGPDLFFTRTSPSKGFDMLPESFNRILLSMLVVGLVSVVVVTKRMATAKMVKHGWL